MLRLMKRTDEADLLFLPELALQLTQALSEHLAESLLPALDLLLHCVRRLAELRAVEGLHPASQALANEAAQGLGRFFIEMSGKVATNRIDGWQLEYRGLILVLVAAQAVSSQEYQELPAWFAHFEGAVRLKNPLISLSAIHGLVDILTSRGEDSAMRHLRRVVQQGSSKTKEYTRQALEKLWSLLDYPHIHSKIIDLIVNFSQCFPNFFTQTVTESFRDTSEVAEKEEGIRRFAHFWRLTAARADGASNQELLELSKKGLYYMLDYLQDVNPLVRQASRSWLNESMAFFSRVMDPLLKDLLASVANKYETPRGQTLFAEVYDTTLVFSHFRRVKAILTVNGLEFLQYIYNHELSESLTELCTRLAEDAQPFIHVRPHGKPPAAEPEEPQVAVICKEILVQELANQEPEPVAEPPKFSYMDLLVITSLRYIETFAAESMQPKFAYENSAVNTSACELLEYLILNIESPKLCRILIEFVLKRLVNLHRFVILN